MATLKEIRNRIRSVKNTKQLTSAMKLVSASKLKRASDAISAALPYATTLESTIATLASSANVEHPLLDRRSPKNVLILAVCSDKGKCGAFNSQVIKAVTKFADQHFEKAENVWIETMGRKGLEVLKQHAGHRHDHVGVMTSLGFEAIRAIGEGIIAEYEAKNVDAVYVIYNHFQSAMTQVLTTQQLLPVVLPEEADSTEPAAEYIFEPSEEELLNVLLPKHVVTQIFKAVLDSAASEHGARMTAMDAATRNASDLIDELSLKYNRARQAAITKELVEIVSGAEALN